ncbi:unnamed protein product [Notodromas monacha]|uniref:DNA-directed RNA polymerase n=1 Tax=Notodromas monacha TaxID=399045 RepID=A0A7R9BGY9_9CRUS|nr:unnamed protein product [Notodromas monacha]CAG0915286.1 unnamed protein product [Notodromas monacha]
MASCLLLSARLPAGSLQRSPLGRIILRKCTTNVRRGMRSAPRSKYTDLIQVSNEDAVTTSTARIKAVSAARALDGISTDDLVFFRLSTIVDGVRHKLSEVPPTEPMTETIAHRIRDLVAPLSHYRAALMEIVDESESITQHSYGALNEYVYILGKVVDPWMLKFKEKNAALTEKGKLRMLRSNLETLALKLRSARVEEWPEADTSYIRTRLEKALNAAEERENRIKPVKTTAKQRAELARIAAAEMEDASRHASFVMSLRAHLELLIHLGRPHDAVETFHQYLRVSAADDSHPRVAHVDLFNLVLRIDAQKGDLTSVKQLFCLMEEFKTDPNAPSFAAVLECVGVAKSKSTFNYDQAKTIVSQVLKGMKERQCSDSDVIYKSHSTLEQKKLIAEGIRIANPLYEIPERRPRYGYMPNPLLNGLCKEHKYAGPNFGVLDSAQMKEFSREQFETEMRGHVDIVPIVRLSNAHHPKEGDEKLIKIAEEKLVEAENKWEETLREVFRKEMEALELQVLASRRQRCITILPYLQCLEQDEFVDLMMQEIRRLSEGSETYTPSTRMMNKQLGQFVMNKYMLKRRSNSGVIGKLEELYGKFADNCIDETGVDIPRVAWQKIVAANQSGPNVDKILHSWPSNVLITVGKFLNQIILNNIKIDARMFNTTNKNQKPLLLPAFFKLYRSQGVMMREELKVHPVAAKLYRLGSHHPLRFDAEVVPMVSPPLPWVSNRFGGYLTSTAKIMRLPPGAHQQFAELNRVPAQQLYPTYDSLNQLSANPWIVNEPVLDLAIDIFVCGGDDHLEIPKPPLACPAPPVITSDMTKKEKFKAHVDKIHLKRLKGEMYSLWCDALYKLSIANHFRKRILWFPHNIDFRGRAYPCPPHFNHLGADLTRALLLFAKGQPLGLKGFDWLKIHLVNLTGHKKRDPISGRLNYANDMMGDIMDSAERPLTGKGWWKDSDEPWQTLAACKEVAAAIRCEAGPENHVSHFPIHQDGSCNGLQHYAALGRDPQGAFSVNLGAAERPQDVYSDVAAMVERERVRDAAKGVKIAAALEGMIKRKVIKQTVMTTVYGVTRYGARLQIAKQLKDLDDFPQDMCFAASQYLTQKTFLCLQEMFTGTKLIQDWFTECARLISGVCGQPVEWISPLGLPVIQPYHRGGKKNFGSSVDATGLRINTRNLVDSFERPNTMKQKNAFPPNFIHSLDSTHMMLTSLYCQQAGISFVSVHDCYWTHPCTVDVMNEICRDQFVALHSQPILEDLRDFMVSKYSFPHQDLDDGGTVQGIAKRKLNRTLTEVPEKGSFDLQQVKHSTYFFS